MWRTVSVSACSMRFIVVLSEPPPQPAIRPAAQQIATNGRTCLALIRSLLWTRWTVPRVSPRPPRRVNGRLGQLPGRREDVAAHQPRGLIALEDSSHERRATEIRPGGDRAGQAGGLGGGRRLRHAGPGGRAGGGLREAVEPLHLGQPAHGPRPRLLDRRRLRPLPPRPRRRRPARLRLRRLRPAGGDGGDRPRREAGRVGRRERRADARADEAARLLLRLRAGLLQLRREPVPLVAVALRHPARGGPGLPRRRDRRLVRQLPDDARRAPGRGRPLLALPQPGAADPPPDLVPAASCPTSRRTTRTWRASRTGTSSR